MKEVRIKMERNDSSTAEGEQEMMDASPVTVLDLTSCQLHDLDTLTLPPTLIELDLTANRLSKLDSRIAHLSNLKKLSFRQNLFDDDTVAPLSSWSSISGLEELIFRDNKLTKILDVSIFKSLQVFDVSFNEISSMGGLATASNKIRELYISKNEVAKIEEIEHLVDLAILELGSNRLRAMENLQNLVNLRELWLGRNRIKTVNLCGLKRIKKLSLQSNRLTSMNGFEECVALEELYLSHNGITKMEGLATLINLRVLDVSSNKLCAVEGIQKLTQLSDLWINDNQIDSLDGIIEGVIASREKLTTIYLENNPCSKTSSYVLILKREFPNLQLTDFNDFS